MKVMIESAANGTFPVFDGYGNPAAAPVSTTGWWFFVSFVYDDDSSVMYAMRESYDDAITIADDIARDEDPPNRLEVIDRVGVQP